MSSRIAALVFAIFVALAVAHAFVPAAQTSGNRAGSVSLANFLDGKKFDPRQNPLARGGKNSWEFEAETMYVEEPKKPVVPKKKRVTPKKKVAEPKSAQYGAFAKAAKKAAPAKKEAPKNPFASLFGK